jgi:single-strand DNA-binding protein
MSSINSIVLVGNLTRDPEVKYVGSNNTAVASSGIAVNRKYGEKEEVTFVDLTFFGKLAEIAGEYLTKGAQVAVQGRLKQESWETDGQKRSKHVVVVENMQMVGSKKGNGKSGEETSVLTNTGGNTDEVPF